MEGNAADKMLANILQEDVARSEILPFAAAAAAVVYSVGNLALSFIAVPAPPAGPQLRPRGSVARAAQGGGEYDVSDAEIEAFYAETISGSSGDAQKGTIPAELIANLFHGKFTSKGFQFGIVRTLFPSATALGGNSNKAALVFLTVLLPLLQVRALPKFPYNHDEIKGPSRRMPTGSTPNGRRS